MARGNRETDWRPLPDDGGPPGGCPWWADDHFLLAAGSADSGDVVQGIAELLPTRRSRGAGCRQTRSRSTREASTKTRNDCE